MRRMASLQSTNPARDYELIGEVQISAPQEIRRKVAAAQRAKWSWGQLGAAARVQALSGVCRAFAERSEEIALLQTREIGKPIQESRIELEEALNYFRWYLDQAAELLAPRTTCQDAHTSHTLYAAPAGVAAVIIPWNYPFCNFVWGVTPNLLAGNPVVLKHSEECPLTGRLLEDIIQGCALPEGVFAEVYGDGAVGAQLARSEVDLIWFTGSTAVGRKLYEQAARRFTRVVLELGGSAPGVVFEDADPLEAAQQIYAGRFFNCGQVCDGLKRLVVHESIAEKVVSRLAEIMRSKRQGDPLEEATDLGSLAAARQVERLRTQVAEAVDRGARTVAGGGAPLALRGAYYTPTLLTSVSTAMRVWQEEVFGPVLPVMTFRDEDQALRLANDTRYGLGAYVFTRDPERAARVARRIESGMVSLNGASYVQPYNPFCGWKQSGIGQEHGPYAFHDLCRMKIVACPA
jgi:succinate-semialdehyde dehydrogenase / glutarate-semialdehyde dehydrogenase